MRACGRRGTRGLLRAWCTVVAVQSAALMMVAQQQVASDAAKHREVAVITEVSTGKEKATALSKCGLWVGMCAAAGSSCTTAANHNNQSGVTHLCRVATCCLPSICRAAHRDSGRAVLQASASHRPRGGRAAARGARLQQDHQQGASDDIPPACHLAVHND